MKESPPIIKDLRALSLFSLMMKTKSFTIKDRVKIFNEDCLQTLSRMRDRGVKVDFVLTSPPYNTAEQISSSLNAHKADFHSRYDVFFDNRTDEEYIEFTLKIFRLLNDVLSENGVIAYNLSYSTNKPYLIWQLVSSVCENTDFVTADCIVWKKSNCFPENVTPNRLSRICEFVFVFVRRKELTTFYANKQVSSTLTTGQKRYKTISNLVTAKNNDGETNKLNRATFSSEFARKILKIYARPKGLVYDPFMGTGTTAAACLQLNEFALRCYGSELSLNQCEYAVKRLKNIPLRKSLFSK